MSEYNEDSINEDFLRGQKEYEAQLSKETERREEVLPEPQLTQQVCTLADIEQLRVVEENSRARLEQVDNLKHQDYKSDLESKGALDDKEFLAKLVNSLSPFILILAAALSNDMDPTIRTMLISGGFGALNITPSGMGRERKLESKDGYGATQRDSMFPPSY